MRTSGIDALCTFAALLSGAFAADAGHGADMSAVAGPNVCNTGVVQSPIDLHPCIKRVEGETYNIPLERPKLKLNYGSGDGELTKHCEADGCSLHISPKSAFATSNIFVVPGRGTYALDKCVIRMPSEHTVNHNHYPLEVQCHHTMEQTDHGRHGVLSILYEVSSKGTGSAFLDSFIKDMPETDAAPSSKKGMNFGVTGTASLSRYHSYSGSQTTGECKEDVDWYVMYDPTAISQAQIDDLKKSMSHHAAGWQAPRPLQRLFGRHAEACHHEHIVEGGTSSTTLGALSVALAVLSLLSRA